MRHIFIILIIISSTIFTLKAQKTLTNTSVIDTIEIFSNKVLVNYERHRQNELKERGQAFLYPVKIKVRKSKVLPSFIKTQIAADSVVLHGTIRTEWKNGNYRIGEYNYGNKTKMEYFNKLEEQISRDEFYEGIRINYDVEKGINIFFIHGRK